MSKLFAAVVAAGLVTTFAMPANAAGAYDKEWTDRCIRDNKDEGQTAQVVAAYCACMVNLMPESETRSVTAWEKSHKREENQCGKQAGWAGK
jgi:hypothetical protein